MKLIPTRTSAGRPSAAPIAGNPARRPGGRSRLLLAALLAALLGAAAMSLVACGSDDGGDTADSGSDVPAAGQEAAAAALEADRTVIDVRTPEEYAVSHVDGADLIDVQGSDFDALVADLDPEGEYVVYCRSGNRSATAAASMTTSGLDVWDGGGLTDMEAAGWPTSAG